MSFILEIIINMLFTMLRDIDYIDDDDDGKQQQHDVSPSRSSSLLASD